MSETQTIPTFTDKVIEAMEKFQQAEPIVGIILYRDQNGCIYWLGNGSYVEYIGMFEVAKFDMMNKLFKQED